MDIFSIFSLSSFWVSPINFYSLLLSYLCGKKKGPAEMPVDEETINWSILPLARYFTSIEIMLRKRKTEHVKHGRMYVCLEHRWDVVVLEHGWDVVVLEHRWDVCCPGTRVGCVLSWAQVGCMLFWNTGWAEELTKRWWTVGLANLGFCLFLTANA